MTMMIMLTELEAEQVRGASSVDPLAALDPIPEPDGNRWMLPLEVLDDPAHAEHHEFLASLSQEDVQPPVLKDESDPDEWYPPSRRGRSRRE